MRESLAELYRRTQMSARMEARLPEDVGEGRIARVRTPQGVSLSTWVMRYHRDTPVEGMVGDELRLLARGNEITVTYHMPVLPIRL